jgi:hypothetical protein
MLIYLQAKDISFLGYTDQRLCTGLYDLVSSPKPTILGLKVDAQSHLDQFIQPTLTFSFDHVLWKNGAIKDPG